MYQTTQPTGGNEFVVQISAKLQYLKSYNYDLFSFYPTNRTPAHWEKILESIEIQDLTDRQPILVYKCPQTGKLFISDGQNRFLACKSSKRPVYAIVVVGESLQKGEASLSVLNSYQKNWKPEDYLEYFCAKGFKDYQNLKRAKELTGFSISTLRKISTVSHADSKRSFEDGRQKFNEDSISSALIVKRVYDAVVKYKLPTEKLSSKQKMVVSIVYFLRSGAKSTELVNQLQKYGHQFRQCGSEAQYFQLWNHLYNYRKHRKTAFQPISRKGRSTRGAIVK